MVEPHEFMTKYTIPAAGRYFGPTVSIATIEAGIPRVFNIIFKTEMYKESEY